MITCSDKDDFISDSESNIGTPVESLNGNSTSSDSSDDEMSDDRTKVQILANGIEENRNSDEMPKMEFGNYENEEFGAELGSDLFSEIENLSYNYLHSNLLLDKE